METSVRKNRERFHKQKKLNPSLIFLVDDQPIFLNLLKNNLMNFVKTRIMTFSSGEECLKKMHLNPSFVVLDYDLKGSDSTKMNGIEVLKNIKRTNPETEVVMLSGLDDVTVATASIKHGAFDYVVKNENALLNIKNKAKNIYERLEVTKKLKEETRIKWVISTMFILILIWTIFANKFMSFF